MLNVKYILNEKWDNDYAKLKLFKNFCLDLICLQKLLYNYNYLYFTECFCIDTFLKIFSRVLESLKC